MKYLKIMLLLVVGSFCMAPSCTPKNKPAETNLTSEAVDATTENKDNNISSDSLLISFEKTPCFGFCPVFKVLFFEKGYVEYEGRNFVEKIGTHKTYINPQVLKDIIKEAETAGFFELNDRYPTDIMDFPTRTIAIKRNGKLKSVKVEEGGVEPFKLVERLLDYQLEELNFKGKAEMPKD